MFSCKFSKIFQNTYFCRTPPVDAFQRVRTGKQHPLSHVGTVLLRPYSLQGCVRN